MGDDVIAALRRSRSDTTTQLVTLMNTMSKDDLLDIALENQMEEFRVESEKLYKWSQQEYGRVGRGALVFLWNDFADMLSGNCEPLAEYFNSKTLLKLRDNEIIKAVNNYNPKESFVAGVAVQDGECLEISSAIVRRDAHRAASLNQERERNLKDAKHDMEVSLAMDNGAAGSVPMSPMTPTTPGGSRSVRSKSVSRRPSLALQRCGNVKCNNYENIPFQFDACGDCGKIVYCSETCQLAHWDEHEKVCVPADQGGGLGFE